MMDPNLKDLLGTNDDHHKIEETTPEEQPKTISITPIKNCDPQEKMFRTLLILDALALRIDSIGDMTIKQLQIFVSDVYRIAHIGHGSCNNPHEDWMDTVDERAFQLHKSGTLYLEKQVSKWKEKNG